MERIRLSKREKQVLRTLDVSDFDRLSEFDKSAICRLHDIGLVRAAFEEGHSPVWAILTTQGKEYLRDNPRLLNPINWTVVGVVIGLLTLAVSVAALFIACLGV